MCKLCRNTAANFSDAGGKIWYNILYYCPAGPGVRTERDGLIRFNLIDNEGKIDSDEALWAAWEGSEAFCRRDGAFRAHIEGLLDAGDAFLTLERRRLTVKRYIARKIKKRAASARGDELKKYKKKLKKSGGRLTAEAQKELDTFSRSEELERRAKERLERSAEYRRLTAPGAETDESILLEYETFLAETREKVLSLCDSMEGDRLDEMTAAEVYGYFAEQVPEGAERPELVGKFLRETLSSILRFGEIEYMERWGAEPSVQLRTLMDYFDPYKLMDALLPDSWPGDFLLSLPSVAAFPAAEDGNGKRRERILREYFRWAGLETAPLRLGEAWAGENLTPELFLSLIRRNPRYGRAAAEYAAALSRREEIHSKILETIPEEFPDLYPNARSMFRYFILHIGPTNSGKSYEALKAFRAAETGVYLAPLRLLAYEVYENTNAAGVPCSMVTGEEAKPVEGARHMASTIEMLDLEQHYDVAVIDEGQMLEDSDRGSRWTAAIMGVCADVIHICAAPYAKNILIRLIEDCGDSFEVVEHERSVPICFDRKKFTFPDSVRKNDALIVFSKKAVIACAAVLQKAGWRVSTIYGALPYDVRQREVRKLGRETDVVVATDAIGMGLNLPIERIVFLQTRKFDGRGNRFLRPAEVQQIAGRAGRQGVFEKGYYTSEFDAARLNRYYERKPREIESVMVEFPRTLISIEGKLSELMEQWSNVSARGIYEIGSIRTQLALCRELEEYTDDKKLIYRFVTIPFEERSQELHDIWKALFLAVWQGKSYDAEEYLEGDLENMELTELEKRYQVCDLLYYYYRILKDEDALRQVGERKRNISERITDLLALQSLPERTCSRCGEPIPWNSDSRFCERCGGRR